MLQKPFGISGYAQAGVAVHCVVIENHPAVTCNPCDKAVQVAGVVHGKATATVAGHVAEDLRVRHGELVGIPQFTGDVGGIRGLGC